MKLNKTINIKTRFLNIKPTKIIWPATQSLSAKVARLKKELLTPGLLSIFVN